MICPNDHSSLSDMQTLSIVIYQYQVSRICFLLTVLYLVLVLPIILLYRSLTAEIEAGTEERTEKEEDETEEHKT